ncbi:MAG: hypothetical protein H7336_11330 [Bacteriovorax sp.]|nr:hypothetical protein [Bacteriovorax sp.]
MKKSFLILLLLGLTGLSSCSNLTKNSVREGHYIVRNGVAQDKQWNENLDLKRISWTHELTLSFDLMMTSIPPQSSFNFWFSKSELDEVNKCGDFRIILAYSLETKAIPYSYLNEQIELAGYKKVDLIEFKKNFFAHPDAEMSSFRLYQLYGICRSQRLDKSLILNFPGFSEKVVN